MKHFLFIFSDAIKVDQDHQNGSSMFSHSLLEFVKNNSTNDIGFIVG